MDLNNTQKAFELIREKRDLENILSLIEEDKCILKIVKPYQSSYGESVIYTTSDLSFIISHFQSKLENVNEQILAL